MADEAVSAELMQEVGAFIAEKSGASLSLSSSTLSLKNKRGSSLSSVTLPAAADSFGVVDADGTSLTAGSVGDTVHIEAGTNVTITGDPSTNTLTIASSGGGGTGDYVVEQGTSGIWTYRKWDSGLAEVWGIYNGSIAITTQAAGYGGYRSAQITAPNWPFKFTATPTVTMTGGQGFNGCIINNMQGTNDTRAQFYLSCGTSNAATTRYLHIQAMGRWK